MSLCCYLITYSLTDLNAHLNVFHEHLTKNCNIDLNQKVLVIVSKKTVPLKLATQNLRNVELILASNLNTLSLLKAKQIILSSLSINDIKETYCD